MSQKGFTLIELLIVVVVVAIASAIVVGMAFTTKDTFGGGERVINEFATRFSERREEAVRLNGLQAATSLENYDAAPLLEIDFSDISKTGSLITNGVDQNRDNHDDDTGQLITHLENQGGSTAWVYSFRNDSLSLPTGWSVISTQKKLSTIGIELIGSPGRGQGIMASRFGFSPNGKTFAYADGVWQSAPPAPDVAADTEPSLDNAPFWAVYFVHTDKPLIRGRNDSVDAAVALAIHPSGRVERYRWTGQTWEGFGSRMVNSY